jgi:proline iminopeptidase
MKLALCSLAIVGCLNPDELVRTTVDDDPTLPAIELGGTRLHAEAYGDPDAPLIIVLHGGPGGDYRALLPLAALADDGYRVVFWDQRGAGLSRRELGDSYTLDGYLEDLRLVVEHYTTSTAQPIIFIGHSWGAMYATWFIDTYGDDGGRIRGAVLSEPGAFTKTELTPFLALENSSVDLVGEQLGDMGWQDQFLTASDQSRADYIDTLGAIRGLPSEHRDPANLTPLWRSGAVVRKKLLALGEDDGFDWTTHLAAFQPPVLFLRGDLNTAAPLEQQQQLAAAYPHASIVTIAGVGHQMIWERTAEYLTDVRAYLGTLAVGGVP